MICIARMGAPVLNEHNQMTVRNILWGYGVLISGVNPEQDLDV